MKSFGARFVSRAIRLRVTTKDGDGLVRLFNGG